MFEGVPGFTRPSRSERVNLPEPRVPVWAAVTVLPSSEGCFPRRLAQEAAPDQRSVTGHSGSGNGREDTQPFPWEPNVTCSHLSLPALEPEIATSFCECDRGTEQRPQALLKSETGVRVVPCVGGGRLRRCLSQDSKKL